MSSSQGHQSISETGILQMENMHATTEEWGSIWDWGNLLDFSVDEPSSLISQDSEDPLANPTVSFISAAEQSDPVAPSLSNRVRKRYPRLTCENFLAGRIPCSCPEMEQDEEEEAIERKRVRVGFSATNRCQVPGCGADITMLKGYHRRHRVCLRCATAKSVVFEGQHKRYCQQCGKFHLLLDFDEGKRSCKRKLERHNNRRRKKSDYSRIDMEMELPENLQIDDANEYGSHAGKEVFLEALADGFHGHEQLPDLATSSEPADQEGSIFCSSLNSQNTHSSSNVSSALTKTQMEGLKVNSRSAFSSSLCDGRSAYSSTCPTGRISFKLYDWNPAEFPRRLRHQIFRWLACMPVELEEYIRPGCTILTLFIAMPQFMWEKLSLDGASNLMHLLNSPGSLLSRRGNMYIHLNNSLFQVQNDGSSLMNIRLEVHVPKLHYVHPNCFEAGKPMVLMVCGSNLLQPKFRFLVSFGGKYLTYDSCIAIPQREPRGGKVEEFNGGSRHEAFTIYISNTDPHLVGPAFIEVENKSGISNFIPVLFGDELICSELGRMHKKLSDLCSHTLDDKASIADMCDILCSRQIETSEVLVDIAWLLRAPQSGKCHICSVSIQIKRLNHLLRFLLEEESVIVLKIVLQYVERLSALEEFTSVVSCKGTDLSLLHQYISEARAILSRGLHSSLPHATEPVAEGCILSMNYVRSGALQTDVVDPRKRSDYGQSSTSSFQTKNATAQSIDAGIRVMLNYFSGGRKRLKRFRHSHNPLSDSVRRYYLMAAIVTFSVCFAVCISLLHPQKVGEVAVSVRRFLFGNSVA